MKNLLLLALILTPTLAHASHEVLAGGWMTTNLNQEGGAISYLAILSPDCQATVVQFTLEGNPVGIRLSPAGSGTWVFGPALLGGPLPVGPLHFGLQVTCANGQVVQWPDLDVPHGPTSPTPTPSPSPSPYPTRNTNIPTLLPTETPTLTMTKTHTPTRTRTSTPTLTPSSSPLPTSTSTPTTLPTNTPIPTLTPIPTSTPVPTSSPTPTVTPYKTPTASPTWNNTPIPLTLDPNCNPFATSEVCAFPFPSSYFQIEDGNTATGYRMNYPQAVVFNTAGSASFSVAPTNVGDGCSPAGPLLVHFGVDINNTYLVNELDLNASLSYNAPIALFDLETGKRVLCLTEMDIRYNASYPNRYALIIRPMEPMATGHRHICVLTDVLRDTSGNKLNSPVPFSYLRDSIITTSSALEQMRPNYETYFTFLASHGYARNHILLAWDFMVASESFLTGSVVSMKNQALADIKVHGVRYSISSVVDNPDNNIAEAVYGNIVVPTFLDANSTIHYDMNHTPIRAAKDLNFPFAMLVPKVAVTLAQPLPLVIFGHGLFGSAIGYFTGGMMHSFGAIGNRGGAILLATDWIGLSEGDLTLIIEKVIPNLDKITLVTDRLQQSLVNNIALTELGMGALSGDPNLTVAPNNLVDTNYVGYYGVSLGGIQGSSLMSISGRFKRATLAVPGCGWINLLSRSVNWNLIAPTMNADYPDPLLQIFGEALIQSRFDLSDPVNLTLLLFKDPLPDAIPGRSVLLQESVGDAQVPNITTEMLARTMGIQQLTPSINTMARMPQDTAPTTQSSVVQYYFPDIVVPNPPPLGDIPPASDNGAHDAFLYKLYAQTQLFNFEQTGTIYQYCTGPCVEN